MTRRPVRGLAPIEAAPAPERPPGPAEILAPDGRVFYRAEDRLYYDEHRREVFSQAALRDLVERADERLARAIAGPVPDPILVAISLAESPAELRELWQRNRDIWTRKYTEHARGRRAVLALPPKEDR